MTKTALKGLNVCYYTLNDYCEETIAEIMGKMEQLSRRQLEIVICIISREVGRLELLHSTCIKDHKNMSYVDKDIRCDEIPTETVLNNVHSEFEIHAAKEGLHILEDQARSQLDVVHTKDDQLVYSKSWSQIENEGASEHLLPTNESSQGDHDNVFDKSDQPQQETEAVTTVPKQTIHSEDFDKTKSCNRKLKELSSTRQPVPRKSSSVCHWIKLNSSKYRMIQQKSTVTSEKVLNTSKVCSETETTSFVCEICEKIFHHKSLLNKHLKVIHNQNRDTILCSYCGKLVMQSRLKTHLEKVHEKPNYSCHICHKGFLRRECLEGHINKHGNKKPYICEFCGRKYAYSTSLTSHKRLCTRAVLPPHLQHSKSREDKDISCICETCGITFEGTSGLKDHYSAKHSSKVQACGHCGKSFHWRPSYNRHVKRCKEKTDLERAKLRKLASSSPGKTFTCECGKQYPYRQSFRRHQKNCLQNQQLDSYVLASKSFDKITLAEYMQ